MNWLDFLPNHPVWDTIILFWIFSAAVNALPLPTDESSAGYRWIYTFLTTLLGHVSDAMNQRHQAAAERALEGQTSSGPKQ
ncbi:MAG: hypothetical protein C5B54_02430 [Acidobacteria bacterium]|nr:MAG: hypothetical protein C5B54_02430 [Acidobacteriota bacterium]